jgi:hypothetical protein
MSHCNEGLAPSHPSRSALLAGSIIHRLTHTAAWVLGHFRELQVYHLSPAECEAQGLPEGSTEPHIYVQPLGNTRWWHFDAWTDGDCLHLRALGWWAEVHYIPKATTGHLEGTV